MSPNDKGGKSKGSEAIEKNDAREGTDKPENDFPAGGLTPDEIDQLPKEVRHQIQSISMGMMRSSSSSKQHPLFEKFNEDHINKYLDYVQRDDDNEFKLKSSNRWFALLYTLLGLGSFLFLVIYLLPSNKALLIELIKILVVFTGGLGSGFGLKTILDKRAK